MLLFSLLGVEGVTWYGNSVLLCLGDNLCQAKWLISIY